jgi:hypothetical protein
MSDLEVDEPQLFDILKKAKGRRPKRFRGRVPTRKVQTTFKVKRLKLRIQRPAGVPPEPSNVANQKQQEYHFVQVPAGQTSYHPSVFQGASQRSSLNSVGSYLDPLSSTPESVQASNRQVSVFQVNIPERGYHITSSQNPKRRTIFEEPQYTDDGYYPMVNRTYELVRKNAVAPMWSRLQPEDDPARHGQQLPMNTGEAMEANEFEMAEVLDYLKDSPDDPFDDMHFEMDTNEDGTSK